MLSSSVRTEGSMFSHPEPGKTRGFCERVIVCAHRLEYATFDDLLAIDEEFGLQKIDGSVYIAGTSVALAPWWVVKLVIEERFLNIFWPDSYVTCLAGYSTNCLRH